VSVISWCPEVLFRLRDHIDGIDNCGGMSPGLLYALFNEHACYIGKTGLSRESGMPGLVARLSEHVRAFLRVHVHEGNRPRYTLLRPAGRDALRFLPVLWCPSSVSLGACETIAISMEAPLANTRDERQHDRGRAVRNKGTRRRPPKHVRVGRSSCPLHSIWSNPFVVDLLQRRMLPKQDQYPGIYGAQLPFGLLYGLQLRAEVARLGGPTAISILPPERGMLALAFMATRNPVLSFFPPKWTRGDRASWLYGLCGDLPLVELQSRRQRSAVVLDRMLRFNALAPRLVQPVKVPSQLWAGTRRTLAAAQRAALPHVSCRPMRD
jgi:hypothetical protein